MFRGIRLAEQTASRTVSLFLDGDVSFLPDNSFPSNIQLLKVCMFMDWPNFVQKYHCYLKIAMSCFPRSSRGTHGPSLSWFVCSWAVCVRYLAVWVSFRAPHFYQSQCCSSMLILLLCVGGGAPDRPAAVTAGGDELHLQPPAVLHLCCKVLRRPG